ncbi:Ig-like domain-containing protein [Shewanella surugensis]|uniref:Ig-like domain-containing protein n=1 Tax=Shewanella surugensis TaxID=212020 RepID=A0ABT0LJV1_9GAMM|nr:Ig-like domain-containing protein [Shewanella surugensis]MCL1127958.1 Ig-like domain-containing protein [Shewanella surugensis]
MSIFITKQSAIVKSVSGPLKVKDSQGGTLSLNTTDYIHAGEMILFNQDSIFSLILNNGHELSHTQIKNNAIQHHSSSAPIPYTELIIDNITPNNIINILEASNDINVTGYILGDIDPKGEIKIDIQGNQYQTYLEQNGRFDIDIPGFELATSNHITVHFNAYDNRGYPYCVSKIKHYQVMLVGPYIDIVLQPISIKHDHISGSTNKKITVTGMAKYHFSIGDKIIITVNNTLYKTQVLKQGSFSIDILLTDILVSNQVTATLISYDMSGNRSEATINQRINDTE